MECLQDNLSVLGFDRGEGSKAYIFDYQAAEKVCDKDDGLHEFEF
jgi:hypothetical protein